MHRIIHNIRNIKVKKHHIMHFLAAKFFVLSLLLLSYSAKSGFGLGTLFSTVTLSIQHTFNPSVSFLSGEIEVVSGVSYTNYQNLSVYLKSATGTFYNMTGDIVYKNGSFGANQTGKMETGVLSLGDGSKNIFVTFTKIWSGGFYIEKITKGPYQIFLDKTAPAKPVITRPIQSSLVSGNFEMKRNSSVDTGVGFREYTYSIALDSGFTNIVYAMTTNLTNIMMDSKLLGKGTFYLLVNAEDKLGNTSYSNKVSFYVTGVSENTHYVTEPKLSTKRYTVTSDFCPGGDRSSSYYDGSCGNTRIDPIIENNSKHMAFDANSKVAILGSEILSAYEYAYGLGITTMSLDKAELMGPLIRKDLAKMISVYATKALNKQLYYPEDVCHYSDDDLETYEARYYMILSCRLGLMGLEYDGKPAKKFDPNEYVTRSQFATVFSRLLFGGKYNGNGDNWYIDHLNALENANIMNLISDPLMIELRGYVMIMMQRTSKKGYQYLGSDILEKK